MTLQTHLEAAGEQYVAAQVAAATEPFTTEIAAQAEQITARDITLALNAAEKATLEARIQTLEAVPIYTEPRYTQMGTPGQVLVIREPGHLHHVEFQGFVKIEAKVAIDHFRVLGGPTPAVNTALVNVAPLGAGTVLSDGILKPTDPTVNSYGLNGGNFTTISLDISGTVDGVMVTNGDWTDYGSTIHDLIYYPRDPWFAAGGTHNDGGQLQNVGGNVTLHGTTIDTVSTGTTGSLSSLMIGANGPLKTFRAKNVDLRGGAVTVNVVGTGMEVFEILNSKIGAGFQTFTGQTYALIIKDTQRIIAKLDGTTMTDGTPLRIKRG